MKRCYMRYRLYHKVTGEKNGLWNSTAQLWNSVATTTLAFALAACQAKPTFNEEIKLRDLTPPQVLSIIPANGETEVSDKPTITVVFSEPMDAATLNSATMTVKTQNGNTAAGFFTYDEAQNALSFTVTQRLYVNTTYVVSLTSGMKDRAGNSLSGFTSSFSTDVCPKSKVSRPVFNDQIRAIAKLGCTLYLGGRFTQLGEGNSYGTLLNASTGHIQASFNYQDINGPVHVAVSDGMGGFYIGGAFTRIGETARNHLAHIAGSGELLPWSPNTNGVVKALVVSGGIIYVGGDFTLVNGQSRDRLAALNTEGQLLNWNPGADGEVLSLAVSGTTVYAGGYFTNIGAVNRQHLAAINSAGQALSWFPDADGAVLALALSGTTIFLGGEFTQVGGQSRNFLAAVATDGTVSATWVPSPDSEVNDITVSGSTVYVGGRFTTINSTTRNHLAAIDTNGTLLPWNPDANGWVYTLTVQDSAVYIGGEFTTVGGNPRNRLAAVNKLTATVESWNPNAEATVLTLAGSGSAIYAGGYFTTVAGKVRNRLAALSTDGRILDWAPNVNGTEIYALAVRGNTIYTGGNFLTVNGLPRNHLAAIAADGSLLSWNPNANSAVYALVATDSHVYVGGDFTCFGVCPGGTEGLNRWTRQRLAAVGHAGDIASWNPHANLAVWTLAINGNFLYVGGNFTCFGASCTLGNRNRLAAFAIDSGNLTTWDPNANGPVHAITTAGTTVYAGGAFTCMGAGCSPGQRNRLAAIDTNGPLLPWNPNVNGTVFAMAANNTNVYFGGNFTTVSGAPRSYLAGVDNNASLLNWQANASGAFAPFSYAIVLSGSTIYAGGEFKAINGNTAFYLASLNADGTLNW